MQNIFQPTNSIFLNGNTESLTYLLIEGEDF